MTARAIPKTPQRLLARLEWRVIRRLDGRLMGGYRTAHRGAGTDLAGLRDYVEGDDARHIDWNVTARLNEPQLRVFTEDRELTAWLVLDLENETALWRRVEYPIDEAAKAIEEAGLPRSLADRLYFGQ